MSHQHPHPHPHPPAGMSAARPPQQMMAQAQLPPHTAAILDALPFSPVPILLKDVPPRPNAPPPLPALLCPEHEQMICDKCNVDFRDINQLGFFMSLLNPSHPPPPPNVPFAKQGEAAVKAREEGNVSPCTCSSELAVLQGLMLKEHYTSLCAIRNGSRTETTVKLELYILVQWDYRWGSPHGNKPSRR